MGDITHQYVYISKYIFIRQTVIVVIQKFRTKDESQLIMCHLQVHKSAKPTLKCLLIKHLNFHLSALGYLRQ